MNQQRSRRFRAALDAEKKEREKEEFRREFLKTNGEYPEEEEKAKAFDSNVITPGTPFMDILAASLRYWSAYKLSTDPGWANLKVIISDATVPGEGEHKIMEFIRSQRQTTTHDPNTRHVIYGLDADLIMLGLATHEPHFRVFREDVFFQSGKPNACRRCGQVGHKAAECQGRAKQKNGEFDEKEKIPPKPYLWLNVNVLREYLAVELFVPNLPFKWDLERAIDDWVFLCFFVGNDFLPHLPSLDIKEEGIDTLTAIWRDNIVQMGGYVTEDGVVNLERAQVILAGLAKQEDEIFKRRKVIEDKRDAGRKRKQEEENRRKRERQTQGSNFGDSALDSPVPAKRTKTGPQPVMPFGPTFDPAQLNSREVRNLSHEQFVNRKGSQQNAQADPSTTNANKSAAAMLKERLQGKKPTEDNNIPHGTESPNPSAQSTPQSALKRKADALIDDNGTSGQDTPSAKQDEDDDGEPKDEVRMWEDGYQERYYERKFGVDPKDIDFRHSVGNAYVEGLCWVLLYYMQGCASWTWYYPHHYAPFAADFVGIKDLKLNFVKGKPFRAFEQLMSVLPIRSNHAIPQVFHSLMTDEDSDIHDFYPEDFVIDLNGKKFEWQGVAILPFIDEVRLLRAMATKYPLLSPEDVKRNEVGEEVLLFSNKHELYDDVITKFYSKKKGETQYALSTNTSDGLAGEISQHDTYIPSSNLESPLSTDEMPDLDEDRSMR